MNDDDNDQWNLFDYAASLRLKLEGMELAAEHRGEWLALARRIAVLLAKQNTARECHADMVARELRRLGLPHCGGPAAGSIFKEKSWEFTGRRIQSCRITNHARELKVWRYRG